MISTIGGLVKMGAMVATAATLPSMGYPLNQVLLSLVAIIIMSYAVEMMLSGSDRKPTREEGAL